MGLAAGISARPPLDSSRDGQEGAKLRVGGPSALPAGSLPHCQDHGLKGLSEKVPDVTSVVVWRSVCTHTQVFGMGKAWI